MSDRATVERRRHLYARKCVECGYDGSLLRGGRAEHCARCGCDLRERPPRSYAEMEGLLGGPLSLTDHVERIREKSRDDAAASLIERWLWFFFLSMILIFAIAALAAKAVAG